MQSLTIKILLATVAVGLPLGCGGSYQSNQPPVTGNGQITFSFGPEETVFNHTTDSCEPLDVPDTPAHAVRLADGSLMLEDGDAPRNYAMFGPDFSTLHKRCTAPILVSDVGRFLLGSASVDLLKQSGESLACRIAYLELTPFVV